MAVSRQPRPRERQPQEQEQGAQKAGYIGQQGQCCNGCTLLSTLTVSLFLSLSYTHTNPHTHTGSADVDSTSEFGIVVTYRLGRLRLLMAAEIDAQQQQQQPQGGQLPYVEMKTYRYDVRVGAAPHALSHMCATEGAGGGWVPGGCEGCAFTAVASLTPKQQPHVCCC